MKNQTLIIIDMQEKFYASADRDTQIAVIENVLKARLANIPIVIVEYSPGRAGGTLDCIMESLGHYTKVLFVEKHANDGGQEVEEVLRENELSGSELWVCGIEIAHCINETITTLVKEFSERIKVISRACYCSKLHTGDMLSKDDIFDINPIYQHELVEVI